MNDVAAPPLPRASWGRIVWTVLLSLFPGLGHVYARAWRIGVALAALDLTWSFLAERFGDPPPLTPAGLLGGWWHFAFWTVVWVAVSVDAVRRTRTAPARPKPRWFRSTWFTFLVIMAIGQVQEHTAPQTVRSFSVPSGSMIPGLLVGDVMLVSTTVPADAIERGDIIVFALPSDPKVDYVKRVIGLPGDRIAMRGGAVVLNGAPVPLRPDGEMVVEEHGVRMSGRRFIETLPSGRAYPVLKLTDTGPANDMPEVTVPPGHFFVMGDNRDNSLDSRFPSQLGPVPTDRLIGRPGVFTWSRDWSRILTEVR